MQQVLAQRPEWATLTPGELAGAFAACPVAAGFEDEEGCSDDEQSGEGESAESGESSASASASPDAGTGTVDFSDWDAVEPVDMPAQDEVFAVPGM